MSTLGWLLLALGVLWLFFLRPGSMMSQSPRTPGPTALGTPPPGVRGDPFSRWLPPSPLTPGGFVPLYSDDPLPYRQSYQGEAVRQLFGGIFAGEPSGFVAAAYPALDNHILGGGDPAFDAAVYGPISPLGPAWPRGVPAPGAFGGGVLSQPDPTFVQPVIGYTGQPIPISVTDYDRWGQATGTTMLGHLPMFFGRGGTSFDASGDPMELT